MTSTDAYRALRQALLMRLGAASVLLIGIGALALTWVPGAGSEHAASGIQATPPAPSAPPVIEREQASPAGGATLADAMRDLSALEPLDGKPFEVIARREVPDERRVDAGGGEAPAESAASPAVLPKGPHLQVGIFAQPANAEELRRRLVAEGHAAYVETRVHIGPFPNRREAERMRDKLKAQGTATLLIPK